MGDQDIGAKFEKASLAKNAAMVLRLLEEGFFPAAENYWKMKFLVAKTERDLIVCQEQFRFLNTMKQWLERMVAAGASANEDVAELFHAAGISGPPV